MKQLRYVLPFLLIIMAVATASFYYDFHRFTGRPLAIPDEGLIYDLKPGTSVIGLAGDLAAAGYLDNPLYFRLLAQYRGAAHRLKAGEYNIPSKITPSDLVTLFTGGEVIQHSLTLIEGWDFAQVLAAINRHEGLVHTLQDLSPKAIMQRLGYPGEHPEGRFYPDTYHFPRGTTDVEFLNRARQRLNAVLDHEWSLRDSNLPLGTSYDALILASIVEKEAALAGERAKIAGVFIRRLGKGMRLQTDPSVIYGMGNAYKGNITRRDLVADTPYNTYLHTGLPPTPICMAGKEAIRAVLHPADGSALYFVARGDGSHYFSATLEEHNIAVQRFQVRNRQMRQSRDLAGTKAQLQEP
jgi:UPF0755 protein